MAQFDLDRIFNNAENQSQKKKKKYDPNIVRTKSASLMRNI